MKRFIQGADRTQVSLLPECVEDYVESENPVRVIEAFVEQLELRALGFEGIDPEITGRPAYHPSVLLKIYIYGYLNRVQSSRRLEQETQRNIELMWLTGRLMPDFKTIETQINASPDKQVSLTAPDARSMKNREGGIVGYNMQVAVDAEHHLIVAHELTNDGLDREQLSSMAGKAKEAVSASELTVVADRGYFKGEEILECTKSGITPLVPKSMTSNSLAAGRFDKQDFIYVAEDNEYRCPAGQRAIYRYTSMEDGLPTDTYWSSACPRCAMRAQC